MFHKGINHYETKSKGMQLLVPVMDVHGKIWNIQYISPHGKKYYIKDGKRNDCLFRLGGQAERAFLCEGYATAASIFQSTNMTTFVCFSSGNLDNVYKILKEELMKSGVALKTIADDNFELKEYMRLHTKGKRG